jgi:hypothetical protein
MKSPHYREEQGILEYFLLVVIAILLVFIVSKLFGPAISNWIQELMKNV